MKKDYKKLVCIFSIIILLVGHAEISATENNSNFANLNTLKEGLLLSKNLKEVDDGFVYDINKDGRIDVLDFCRLKRDILHKEPSVTTTPITEPPVTEPIVTEPPVTEPIWRDPDDYRLEEIAYDGEAFNQIAYRLKKDLLNGNGIETEYGTVWGSAEAACILAILNNGKINEDVLTYNLGMYTAEYLTICTKFIYKICYAQELCGTDLDFEKYTLDPSIGQFLNSIDDEFRNGTINDKMYDMFVNGNYIEEHIYNPSTLPVICSYGRNSYLLGSENVDYICMDAYIDNLCKTVLGDSYTK